MASNLAIDHLRGEARRSELLQEAHAFRGEEAGPTSPETVLIARQELMRFEAALAELPELSRRIFYLTRFEGLSQREVAAIVGLSNTAVFKHRRKVFAHLSKVRDALSR
jgi:RNA polymerase sigma-70 factor (ECF subfamily)